MERALCRHVLPRRHPLHRSHYFKSGKHFGYASLIDKILWVSYENHLYELARR